MMKYTAAVTNKGSKGIKVLPLTVSVLYINSCIPIIETMEDSLIIAKTHCLAGVYFMA